MRISKLGIKNIYIWESFNPETLGKGEKKYLRLWGGGPVYRYSWEKPLKES